MHARALGAGVVYWSLMGRLEALVRGMQAGRAGVWCVSTWCCIQRGLSSGVARELVVGMRCDRWSLAVRTSGLAKRASASVMLFMLRVAG